MGSTSKSLNEVTRKFTYKSDQKKWNTKYWQTNSPEQVTYVSDRFGENFLTAPISPDRAKDRARPKSPALARRGPWRGPRWRVFFLARLTLYPKTNSKTTQKKIFFCIFKFWFWQQKFICLPNDQLLRFEKIFRRSIRCCLKNNPINSFSVDCIKDHTVQKTWYST